MRSILVALTFSLVALGACSPSAPADPGATTTTAQQAVNNEEAAAAPQEEQAAPEAAAAPQEEQAVNNNDPLAAPADVAAPPADAEVTASGLASKVLTPGTGTEHPTASSTVKVHYTGWTTDGERFDSSVARGQQIEFPLNRVIAGWTEGLQLMVVGEKRRFWIPEALAYQGRPGAPAGMLVFDVELFEFR